MVVENVKLLANLHVKLLAQLQIKSAKDNFKIILSGEGITKIIPSPYLFIIVFRKNIHIFSCGYIIEVLKIRRTDYEYDT